MAREMKPGVNNWQMRTQDVQPNYIPEEDEHLYPLAQVAHLGLSAPNYIPDSPERQADYVMPSQVETQITPWQERYGLDSKPGVVPAKDPLKSTKRTLNPMSGETG